MRLGPAALLAMITVVAAAMIVRAPCISYCPLTSFWISFVPDVFPMNFTVSVFLQVLLPAMIDHPMAGTFPAIFHLCFIQNTTNHNPVHYFSLSRTPQHQHHSNSNPNTLSHVNRHTPSSPAATITAVILRHITVTTTGVTTVVTTVVTTAVTTEASRIFGVTFGFVT